MGEEGTPEVCALTRRVRVLSRRVNERGRDIQLEPSFLMRASLSFSGV